MLRLLFRCWESEVSSILLEWQVLHRLSLASAPGITFWFFFFFCPKFKFSIWEHTRKNITLLWEEVFEEVVSICPASVCILEMPGVSSWGWAGEACSLPTEQDLTYLFGKEAIVYASADLGRQQICEEWRSQLNSFASG